MVFAGRFRLRRCADYLSGAVPGPVTDVLKEDPGVTAVVLDRGRAGLRSSLTLLCFPGSQFRWPVQVPVVMQPAGFGWCWFRRASRGRLGWLPGLRTGRRCRTSR